MSKTWSAASPAVRSAGVPARPAVEAASRAPKSANSRRADVPPGDPDVILTPGNTYIYADTEPMIDEHARMQEFAKALLD